MSCPLCERKLRTKFYYEDHLIWIVDCETCSSKKKPIPLAVFKKHVPRLTVWQKNEWDDMTNILNRIGKEVFGFGNFRIDRKMRKLPLHTHYHARPI